jgi:hypothetical protein
MKKEFILRVLGVLSMIIFFGFVNLLKAQEIEITSDHYYLRSKDHKSSFYGLPSGNIILAGRPSDLFTIVVDNSSIRGFRILNNWAFPAAFEVYGSGLVKANGIVLTSDALEKEQIKDLGSQMDKIKKLKAVSYKWKDKEAKGEKTIFGLLAQDLEKVYPDMVFRGDSGELGIYYIELIPVMLEAIQEQQAIIEQQQKQLLGIEQRLEKLEKKSK